MANTIWAKTAVDPALGRYWPVAGRPFNNLAAKSQAATVPPRRRSWLVNRRRVVTWRPPTDPAFFLLKKPNRHRLFPESWDNRFADRTGVSRWAESTTDGGYSLSAGCREGWGVDGESAFPNGGLALYTPSTKPISPRFSGKGSVSTLLSSPARRCAGGGGWTQHGVVNDSGITIVNTCRSFGKRPANWSAHKNWL